MIHHSAVPSPGTLPPPGPAPGSIRRTAPARISGAVSALSAAALLLTGCMAPAGSPAGPASSGPPAAETPHGYVAGAAEAAEPQARLTAVSADGQVSVTDPADESVTELGTFPGVKAATGTGRFVFLSNPEDGTVHVVDAGGWTVNHGDHRHYYSAEPRVVGSINGPDPGSIASNDGRSAVFFGDGTVAVLDHEDLGAGTVTETRFTVAAHRGVAVPFGDSVLVSAAEPGAEHASAVGLYSADGRRAGITGARCPELEGHAVTRTGAVFGCADGALVITAGDSGAPVARHIPYPDTDDGAAPGVERARAFDHRPGSNELAAVAGTAGAWHFDAAAEAWQLLATPEPLLTAAAAGDGTRVLGLGTGGTLFALNTGPVPAVSPVDTSRHLLAGPAAPDTVPGLEIDPERAYINDEHSGSIVEIDYADGLRTARELDPGLPARLIVETGR